MYVLIIFYFILFLLSIYKSYYLIHFIIFIYLNHVIKIYLRN